MKRVVNVDAQGREEMMKAVRETNERLREIEDNYFEQPDDGWTIFPRVVALPASEEQVAEAQAAKARERGTPPL